MEGEPRAPGRRPPRTRLQPAAKHARCGNCSERATRLERAVQRSQLLEARGKSRRAGRPATSRALVVSQPHQVELQAQSISRKCGLLTNER
jgi:hypothetical protein